jgi:prepilin-type N-terminal cleavage/methylation domain-containing protein
MHSSSKPIQALEVAMVPGVLRYDRCNGGSVLRTQKGFTLIELMVVVAIIGILAGLAIYSFGGTQKKTKARGEVAAVFAEFKVRQEQYMLENRTYLSSNAADDEDTRHPTAGPAADGSKTAFLPLPAEWGVNNLKMATGFASTYCSYVAIAGVAADAGNIGTIAGGDFGFTAPATEDWYYLLAHCDMDQDGGATADSFYFQRFDDSQLYFINQGK